MYLHFDDGDEQLIDMEEVSYVILRDPVIDQRTEIPWIFLSLLIGSSYESAVARTQVVLLRRLVEKERPTITRPTIVGPTSHGL